MEKFYLDPSPKTPLIDFNGETGVLELRGRSIPENSVEFYAPLTEWLIDYGDSAQGQTTVEMKLEYFNTSSSKCILDFFKQLERINGNSTSVHVNWYFEKDDEDMAEAGEDYEAIVALPFSIIEVDEI
jgi:hypothetical protein